jgi:hypothetical protein
MNKKFFGFEVFGQHVLIRLRVKLNERELADIRSKYAGDLHFTDSTKGCTKIEGCLRTHDVHKFKTNLNIAMLNTKKAELDNKLELELFFLYGSTQPEVDSKEWVFADLDKI